MQNITYCEAIRQALMEEMQRDKNVFVYGIGVPDKEAIFGSTKGLQEKFGKDRVFDTPLSEDSLMGFGIGAAINGMRPINIHIRADFLLLAVNQIINVMASMEYVTNGQLKVPMVIRVIIGRGWGQGCQHSKSLYSLFCHIPGLRVIAPTTPYDVKYMLKAAIQSNGPVLVFEHRWLYYQAEDVIDFEAYDIELNDWKGGVIRRKGNNITLVGISWMVIECMKAAEVLKAKHNIEAEVIDQRVLAPIDIEVIKDSSIKTKYCIIADNDWTACGYSAEIKAGINDNYCYTERLGFANTHCPTARHLENEFYPNAKTIIRLTEKMLGLDKKNLDDIDFYSHENRFTGPF